MKKAFFRKTVTAALAAAMLSGSLPVFAADAATASPEPAETAAVTSAPEETAAASSAPTEAAVSETPSEQPTAAPAATPAAVLTPTPSGPTATTVTVHVTMQQKPYTTDSFAALELYSSSGTLLDSDALWVGGITTDLTYVFDVPEYTIGESFTLKLTGGLTNLKYYDNTYHAGDSFIISSYADMSSGTAMPSVCELDGTPLYQKSVALSYDGVPVSLTGARVMDGTAMVPIAELAQYIGLDTYYNSEYNTQVVSLGGNAMYFNLDTVYTTVFGTDLNAPHATVWSNGAVYVPLRTFSDGLGSTLEVTDGGDTLYIAMSSSPVVNDYFNNMLVNRSGISSRTDYLVWISLNEFKVRVYLGKQYQWKPIREMTCATGAPGSPTITGSFEYQYSMPRWDYGTYYVGPCLVFYGNYAMHSVFLYQDGSEYDGRVGMQLSHGCVRLKKVDIDWLYSMIPVGTRIYITP